MEKIEIIGNIGKDAELKSINGNDYAMFDVAVTERYRETERTTWYSCAKFDKDKKLVNHLTKGTKVYISGRPQASAYTNNAGKTVSQINIWVNDLEFCGPAKQAPQEAPKQAPQYGSSINDDDLTF